MVERSLSMREAPGSIPGLSILFFPCLQSLCSTLAASLSDFSRLVRHTSAPQGGGMCFIQVCWGTLVCLKLSVAPETVRETASGHNEGGVAVSGIHSNFFFLFRVGIDPGIHAIQRSFETHTISVTISAMATHERNGWEWRIMTCVS